MKYKHRFVDFAREGRRPKKRSWHKMEDENQTSIAEVDYVVDGWYQFALANTLNFMTGLH